MSRFVCLCLLSASLLSACGVSPVDSAPPSAASPTDSPGPAAEMAAGLDGLSSYQYTITITSAGLTGSVFAPGSLTISGTVLNGSQLAETSTATLTDESGRSSLISGTVIDGRAWFDFGQGPEPLTDPSADPFADLRPARLYQALIDSLSGGLGRASPAVRDGLATRHFRVGSQALTGLSERYGLTAPVSLDVDRSVDHDALANLVLASHGAKGGPSLDITISISHVNDPTNVVKPPKTTG